MQIGKRFRLFYNTITSLSFLGCTRRKGTYRISTARPHCLPILSIDPALMFLLPQLVVKNRVVTLLFLHHNAPIMY